MADTPTPRYVSRGGIKLAAALDAFQIDPAGWHCADLGSNVGGFVDCLLHRGAARVHAVDTGYGVLDYRLRRDARVVVLERTNALHARLPEPVDLVTIDVGWTRQRRILPAARGMLKSGGAIITLVKPHYEARRELLRRGVLPAEHLEGVLEEVRRELADLGLRPVAEINSPIAGSAGNRECLWLFRPRLLPSEPRPPACAGRSGSG